MMRKLMAVFFAAFAVAFAWAADTWTDESGNVWTYTTNKVAATVSAVSFETTTLTIPDTLGGKPVTAFNDSVFAGKTRAVRVTIPETVTAIPAEAFLDCGNLKAVTINGSGLTSIGARAFKGCGNLGAFVMPNSVTSLGQGVFSGCSAMESVTLSDGLTTLTSVAFTDGYYNAGTYRDYDNQATLAGYYENGLFYNCTSLKTINWGANVKTIGNIAFLNCSALESVTIPDTVTSVGYHAFLGCSSLTTVKIGNGVTVVGRRAFRALPNLTKVTFGTKVSEIQQQAFQDCVNLQNFALPDTIQYLRFRCFAGCNKALTEVTIPTNKDELETELGQGVFAGCSKLATVTFGDTVKTLTGVAFTDGYYNAGTYHDYDNQTTLAGYYGNGLFYNCTSLKTINWGANVKTIGNIAFLNCSALESVTIPDTVTSIGCHAFLGCASLTNVKIGDGVTVVGRMAFRALPNLTKVTFGTKVSEIQQQAFQDCVNLQNFTLPDTIQYLRFRCFAGCSKALTSVTIPTNKDELETELEKGVFSGCSKLATVTFGDTVKTLTGVAFTDGYYNAGTYHDYDNQTTLAGYYGNGLFYNCTSLKTINWGANVKTIGNIAFLNCSALESVTIPDTVTSVGCHAFLGCASLTNVKIGDRVTVVGRMAFRALPNLTKVTFGTKVSEIQQQAFQDCVNLQNFALPDTIQYLRFRCFAGCSKALTSVTIPTNKDELETELGQGVFSGCSKLATVTFGDTVKTLTGVAFTDGYYNAGTYRDYDNQATLAGYYENALFYNCTSLKTINWGANVKTIGNIAFLNCKALIKLTLPASITDIGNHAFYGCSGLKIVTVRGDVNSLGRRAFANCPSLLYVDFQGEKMDADPGYQPFAFDSKDLTIYAAEGSSGWKGIVGVVGLPPSGTWCGVPIAYSTGQVSNKWTVKYHQNDPNSVEDVTRSQNIPVGETQRLLYLDSALKWALKDEDGFSYIFLGWAKSPTGAAFYENGEQVCDLVSYGKVLHLYAVWQKRSYNVCFHSNDGRGLVDWQEFRPNIAKNLYWLDSGLGWTRSGYDFLGWAKAPTSTAVVYTNGQNVNNLMEIGEDLHLYAVWRDRRWTIRYHRNYSSTDNEYEDQKIPVGASVKLYWLDSQLGWTRDGYRFKGWAKSRTAGAAYQNGQTVKDLVPGGQVLHIYGAWGQKTK